MAPTTILPLLLSLSHHTHTKRLSVQCGTNVHGLWSTEHIEFEFNLPFNANRVDISACNSNLDTILKLFDDSSSSKYPNIPILADDDACDNDYGSSWISARNGLKSGIYTLELTADPIDQEGEYEIDIWCDGDDPIDVEAAVKEISSTLSKDEHAGSSLMRWAVMASIIALVVLAVFVYAVIASEELTISERSYFPDADHEMECLSSSSWSSSSTPCSPSSSPLGPLNDVSLQMVRRPPAHSKSRNQSIGDFSNQNKKPLLISLSQTENVYFEDSLSDDAMMSEMKEFSFKFSSQNLDLRIYPSGTA